MGIMMKPAEERATAPEKRLARVVSCGRAEEVCCCRRMYDTLCLPSTLDIVLFLTPISRFASEVRKAFKVVKYSALPQLVRMTEGNVPRHNCLMGLGCDRIKRIVAKSEVEPDCWTRVLRRSAG